MLRRATWAGLVAVWMTSFAVPVAADELSDFEAARRSYDRQSYAKAARGFESLVGGAVPRASNPVVRLESRKYLGATYLFLGRDKAAREQFRLLLEEDPEYDLDPVAFPGAVVETFQEVQAEVGEERAAREAVEKARVERERAGEVEELIRQQQRIEQLEALASTTVVEKRNSRWIAALPFGVGQFQNENRRLGIMFAVTETAFLAASIATFVGHNSLRDENPSPDQLDRARRVERALRIGNWVSVGALLSFYVAGVVEAEVRFRPVIVEERRRELPEEQPPPQSRRPELRLQLGLTGGSLRVDF